MTMHKGYSDKTKCMYFIVFLKFFDKYMTIRERVSNIIEKKFKSELIYNKKYLKAERRFNTKESFQGFYIPEYCLIQFIEKMKIFIQNEF